MRHRTHPQPHLVTSAPLSAEEEFNARKRRYLITMSLRIVLLAVAVLTAQFSIWLAVSVGLVSTVLPWIAVVMANDGPPKKRRPRGSAGGTTDRSSRHVINAGPVVIDENGATVRDDSQKGDSA